MNLLQTTTEVLRDPQTLINHNDTPTGTTQLAPQLLTLTLLGGLAFGAVTGSYRGGIQVAYAAIKFPIFLLAPLLLTLPTIHALYLACDVQLTWRRLSLATLAGCARTSILLAATGPILWLTYSLHPDYHLAILMMVTTILLVGLPGLTTVARTLPGNGTLRWGASLGSIALMGLLMAQTGWLLRPFVTRPAGEVSFLRSSEEDVFSSLGATISAALGTYQDWEPTRSGAIGRHTQ